MEYILSIKKWMIENREWVFGGIGVSLPLALFSFIKSKNKLPKHSNQTINSGNSSINIQVGRDYNAKQQ